MTSVTIGKIIATGFFLSLGFWGAKKITNKIDELLFVYNLDNVKGKPNG